jgi:Txe/YoeB family toxin of Txe-Axe toxin-antitoxin module
MRTGGALQWDLPRDVEFHGDIAPSYDFSFGVTPEQLFSPVGTKRYSDDGQRDKLPYTLEPVLGSAGYGGHNNDTYAAFYNFYASPTAKDLDPYFFVGKVDFGAVVMDDFQWFQGNNIHLANNDNQIPKAVKEVRGYGLRGPLLLSGWGYDVCGYPVPGNGAGYFKPSPAENRADWKTGPVDLKWDDERQVWSGGPQFIEGILTKAIKRAKSPDEPDLNGVVKIRRRTATNWSAAAGNSNSYFGEPTKWKWHETGELIGITNRDPTLSVDPEEADYDIYVMATRINQEWRVVYTSCDNLDVEE